LIESKVFGAEPAAERQRALRRASRSHVPAAARYLIHRPLPAADVGLLLAVETLPEPYLRSIDRLYADCGDEATDVDRIQEVMIRSFLAENILTFADSVAMDHSAELRMPFLDRDLAEFVFSLDPTERVSPWPGRANTKRILRRWARGRVPDDVLERRKHGFNYGGLGELLAANGGRLRSLLLDGGPVRRAVPGLERWLACSAEGIRGAQETSLWALLALAAWSDAARRSLSGAIEPIGRGIRWAAPAVARAQATRAPAETRCLTRSAPNTPQRVPAAVPATQLAITPEVKGADWR
jgi:hypothetical protein